MSIIANSLEHHSLVFAALIDQQSSILSLGFWVYGEYAPSCQDIDVVGLCLPECVRVSSDFLRTPDWLVLQGTINHIPYRVHLTMHAGTAHSADVNQTLNLGIFARRGEPTLANIMPPFVLLNISSTRRQR